MSADLFSPLPIGVTAKGELLTLRMMATGQLRAFIERIETLEAEKQSIADDIKDIYAEIKGTGFDTRAVRAIVRLRRLDAAERQEMESILDLYMAALGMA